MNRRRLLACGTGTSISVLAGCTDHLGRLGGGDESLEANEDWPRPEFDPGATGYNENVSGPVEEPSIRWEQAAPVDSNHLPAVVVSDGTAFVAGGSTVTALAATDGSERWQTEIAEPLRVGGAAEQHCSATVGDEHLYVGTHEGLTAMTTDGEYVWSHDTEVETGFSGVFRSPAVKDGVVYFCTAHEQTVYAYTTTGEQLWQYELEGSIYGSPAVTDDSVFIADTAVGLHALSTAGDHRWTAEFEEGTPSYGITPTVADGNVHISGQGPQHDHFIGAYDLETGEEVWRNDLVPLIYGSLAVIDDGTRFLAASSFNSVYIYDLEDGSLRMNASTDAGAASRTVSTLTADDEFGYATSHGAVTKFTPYGLREWQVSFDTAIGSLTILEDELVVASTGGRCFGLA